MSYIRLLSTLMSYTRLLSIMSYTRLLSTLMSYTRLSHALDLVSTRELSWRDSLSSSVVSIPHCLGLWSARGYEGTHKLYSSIAL